MASIKISELNAKTILKDNDVLPIVDTDNNETQKISIEDFKNTFGYAYYKWVMPMTSVNSISINLSELQEFDFIDIIYGSAFDTSVARIPKEYYDTSTSTNSTMQLSTFSKTTSGSSTYFMFDNKELIFSKTNGTLSSGDGYRLTLPSGSPIQTNQAITFRGIIGYKLLDKTPNEE